MYHVDALLTVHPQNLSTTELDCEEWIQIDCSIETFELEAGPLVVN